MNAQKIVVLDCNNIDMGDINWQKLKDQCSDFSIYDFTPADKVVERIGNADVIFTNKVAVNAEQMTACPNLKFIGIFATGYNLVDVVEAGKRNIIVTNTPGYSSYSVAQQAWALLLEITNGIGERNAKVKDGQWLKHPELTFWGDGLMELAYKAMGIIGYGNIGQAVAKIADAVGMKVIYYNPSTKPPTNPAFKQLTLDEVLAQSDVISLNCPLFPETENIINKNSIAKMKDGAIIINASRGALINEQDMASALNSGKIAALGCDVVSKEPIENNNPLLTAKNTFIAPHLAWAPPATRQRCIDMATQNLASFLANKPENVVTKF